MRAVASAILLLVLVPVAARSFDSPLILSLLKGERLAQDRQPASSTPASQVDVARPCGPSGRSHMRTTLYFGLTRPMGTVSEDEWAGFLREQVTPRFPDGLTVWEAEGQWRRPDGSIGRERSKVLLLVHDETPAARDTLGDLVATYKRMFEQESVLWESSRVCATF